VQIIRKNFGLKVLSITLAIVGWAYIRYATNPIVAAARFDQQISVPIAAVNLPVGYIAHFTDKEAVVTVATKHGDAPIKPDEIKAVLDLQNKGAGIYNVPVLLVAPDVVVQSLSPASVTLSIERIDQRAFAVETHYVGTAPAGLVVKSNPVMKPAVVTISGPASLLSQVADVRVDVEMPGGPKTLDAMIRPIAVNSLGAEIAGLEVDPDLVRVQTQFVTATGAKTPK
jgi:YbbR domain-containing protein